MSNECVYVDSINRKNYFLKKFLYKLYNPTVIFRKFYYTLCILFLKGMYSNFKQTKRREKRKDEIQGVQLERSANDNILMDELLIVIKYKQSAQNSNAFPSTSRYSVSQRQRIND